MIAAKVLAGKTILFSGDPDALGPLVRTIKRAGATTVWWGEKPTEAKWLFDWCMKVDFKKLDSLELAMVRLRKKYGHLHGAVNMPEAPNPVKFLESSRQQWEVIGPSVADLAMQTKVQVGKMLETGGGIILTALSYIEESPIEAVWITAIQEVATQIDFQYAENSVRAFNFYDSTDDEMVNYLAGIGVPELNMSYADDVVPNS
ncbi:MAG: hypothetical protein JNK63_03500 [Chthonomonas sp.]|nr:hypothetical protein [Chthonomonas sp.]